jgi:ABC-type Na+ efflux pump permease subunit
MKTFKSLFYTGLLIVMLPVFLFLVMVILPLFVGINYDKTEPKEVVLVYDTVEVKQVIKVYDTIKPKKRVNKKKEEEIKIEVKSDSIISD